MKLDDIKQHKVVDARTGKKTIIEKVVTQEMVDEENARLAQQEKDNIKRQLEELDKKCPRWFEDYLAGDTARIDKAIEDKKVLREKLK